jgi:hypothetical protein
MDHTRLTPTAHGRRASEEIGDDPWPPGTIENL